MGYCACLMLVECLELFILLPAQLMFTVHYVLTTLDTTFTINLWECPL